MSSPGPKSASFPCRARQARPLATGTRTHAESGGPRARRGLSLLSTYFCFLFDSKPVRVSAQTTWPAGGRLPFPDSVAAQIEFADGSCGQLIYTAEGDLSISPGNAARCFGAGLVAEISEFPKALTVHRGRKESKQFFVYLAKATPSR